MDRQVNEKRKLEQTVVEMTKRQAELTSASLHKVDMTMRRVGRPSSASSHGSRSRYIVSSPEIMGRPSSASSSSRRSHRGSYTSGKKSKLRPKSGDSRRSRKTFLSPNDSRITGEQTLLRVIDNEDDLLTNSPSGTFADQKHSDEDDKTASDLSTMQDSSANIDRIQTLEKTKEDLTSQIQKRDLEIASQKRLVNTLQDSVMHLNNELEALSNERSQIEKQNQQKIKSISVRAKKQLQYQQARCESLEAIVNDLKKRLETQEKNMKASRKQKNLSVKIRWKNFNFSSQL